MTSFVYENLIFILLVSLSGLSNNWKWFTVNFNLCRVHLEHLWSLVIKLRFGSVDIHEQFLGP